MQVLNVTNLPIYLPYDRAPLPFGDPILGVTATAAAPGVITNPDTGGYTPVAGDAVSFSFQAGGALPAPLVVGQQYFVVAPISAGTFAVSATKGGSAITTTTTGSLITLHLLSNQVDGVTLPFKPTATVVVQNTTGGALVLQGAADTGQAAAGTSTYNPPSGPGSFSTIVSVPANSSVLAVLNFDWIRVSTAATLQLLQN